MPKYRLLDDIDWDRLNDKTVRIEVDHRKIIVVPLNKSIPETTIARAVKPKAAKNGQPSVELTESSPVTTEVSHEA